MAVHSKQGKMQVVWHLLCWENLSEMPVSTITNSSKGSTGGTDQGPSVGGQGPNLAVQWVATLDPGGHWMTGQTRASRGLLLSTTSSSSPSGEVWRQHKIKHDATDTGVNNISFSGWTHALQIHFSLHLVLPYCILAYFINEWIIVITLYCWRSRFCSQNCCSKPQRWHWRLPQRQTDAQQMCFSQTAQLLKWNNVISLNRHLSVQKGTNKIKWANRLKNRELYEEKNESKRSSTLMW